MSASPEKPFDQAKTQRLAEHFIRLIHELDATAGEACAAASFVFKQAIETAPTAEETDQIRAACIKAMDVPRLDS